VGEFSASERSARRSSAIKNDSVSGFNKQTINKYSEEYSEHSFEQVIDTQGEDEDKHAPEDVGVAMGTLPSAIPKLLDSPKSEEQDYEF